MPSVTIRTGIVDAEGREEILTEYLCDWPGCAKVAEHLIGAIVELGAVSVLCREHAVMLRRRTHGPRPD